jgi:hypothetical protein
MKLFVLLRERASRACDEKTSGTSGRECEKRERERKSVLKAVMSWDWNERQKAEESERPVPRDEWRPTERMRASQNER